MLPHDITRNGEYGDITEVKILNINKYYKTDNNVDIYLCYIHWKLRIELSK